MIPVDQTEHGPFGNCLAACVASLLEVPVEEVPNFMLGLPAWDPDDEEAQARWSRAFFTAVNGWLAPRGFFYFEVGSPEGLPAYVTDTTPADALWIGMGEVEGGAWHAVVMRGGEMVHDPHPGRAGLLHLSTVGLLVPLDPAGRNAMKPPLVVGGKP